MHACRRREPATVHNFEGQLLDTVIVFALLQHRTLPLPPSFLRKSLWPRVIAFLWEVEIALLIIHLSSGMIAGQSPYSYQVLGSSDRFLLHGILCSWRWGWRGRDLSAIIFSCADRRQVSRATYIFRFLKARFQIFTLLCRSRLISWVLCLGCCRSWSCNQTSKTSHSNYLLYARSFIWATLDRENWASTDTARSGSCPPLFASSSSMFSTQGRIC